MGRFKYGRERKNRRERVAQQRKHANAIWKPTTLYYGGVGMELPCMGR